ncbi:MAG: phosphatidate cytidylyltransferase [Lachnospirales bacterium]
MKTRVISALVALPVLLLPIFFGGALMYIMCLGAGVIGFFEFTKAVNGKITKSSIITACFALPFYIALYFKVYYLLPLLFCVLLVVNMIHLVAKHNEENINNITINFFAFSYTIVTFALIATIRGYENGIILVFPIFLTAFSSDTFAYFGGRAFGKRKLSPKLSPNKTIEGSISGALASGLIILFYFMYFINKLNLDLVNLEVEIIFVVVFFVGVIGACISQVGDLFASAVKRYTGIKDFGKLIPGHGGIVDRFDSVIMVAPIYFIVYDILYKI